MDPPDFLHSIKRRVIEPKKEVPKQLSQADEKAINTLKRLIPEKWASALASEFEQAYFASLAKKVLDAYEEQSVCPRKKYLFRALELTEPDAVKVVIIG